METSQRRQPAPVKGGNLKGPVSAPQIPWARTTGPEDDAAAGPTTACASLAAACSSCARWRKLLPSSGRNAGSAAMKQKPLPNATATPTVDGNHVGVGAHVLHLLGPTRPLAGRHQVGGSQAPSCGASGGQSARWR